MPTFFTEVFDEPTPVAPLGLIVMESARELGKAIDNYLVNWYNRDLAKHNREFTKKDTFIIDSVCPRFTTGDGKGMINGSVRGRDLYIITDVGNYSCKYSMYGNENCMSPDAHGVQFL